MSGIETRQARRTRTGGHAFAAGQLAEDQVAAHYQAAGCALLARRWRGAAGEIDLVIGDGDTIVFVEVKAAATHAAAAGRLGRRQMDRLCRAACEYCAALPAGQETAMRLDAALVDGLGRIEILRDAFGQA